MSATIGDHDWLPGTECANSPCDLGDAQDHAACCTPCDPTTHAVWSRTNSNPGEWVRTKLGQFLITLDPLTNIRNLMMH